MLRPLPPRNCFSLIALAFFTVSCFGIYRASSALAFTPNSLLWNRYYKLLRRDMMNHGNACDSPRLTNDGSPHPSTLPGDPSLILTTNLDLKDQKVEIMKAISKSIQKHTGKPEAYIAVCINDNASLIWAGSDAPAALGTMYSIGAISVTSNGGITKDITELLEPFGLAAGRIYVTFFDIPRANCGWNKATFAG